MGNLLETLPEYTARFNRIKNYLSGLITANADNDPAGVTTYAVAGAVTGFSQLWLMILAIPMLLAIQAMSARIGDVTHKGLGVTIRENFPRPIAYLALIGLCITTTLMIGADLTGVATAIELVTGVKFILWLVPVALIIWLSVMFLKFEAITRFLALLTLLFLAYIFSAFLAHPDWGQILHAIILPSLQFTPTSILSAIGILGATFTPPLLFWQTEEEVEEEGVDKIDKARTIRKSLAPGFLFAQLVTVFIMIATAQTLFSHHIQVKTAADAAKALEPFAGPAAKYLFAVGMIASGLISIPVLSASAGYMIAELFNWRNSLSDKVDQSKGFYIVITVALFAGVEIGLAGLDPIQTLFYSQVLGGMIGPVILLLLMILSNNRRILGEFANSWFDNLFGGLAFLALSISTIAFFIHPGG